MQNLGILDEQYTILSVRHSEFIRLYYNAKHNQTNVNYIIEIKRPGNNHELHHDNFPANEINILNAINNSNNPYILRYIGNGNGILALNNEPPTNVSYIVYENTPKFDLFEYMASQRLPERQAKLLFKKILTGIQLLHNLNIVHGDIKPENILLDENYNPKIYGLYFSCFNANNLMAYLGTKSFAAPEINEMRPFDGIVCDIFSLGQLLFNIVNGMFGFHSTVNDRHYRLIKNHQFDEYWQNDSFNGLNLSQSFKNLFVRMVAYNPNERPSIDQILNDEWMQEINNLNADQMNGLENELRQELHNREIAFQNNH